MKYMLHIALPAIALLTSLTASAQDSLLAMLGDDEPRTEYAYATFKGTRIINGQSVENPANGVLVFLISHRFGAINQGAYEFFGLDQATTRIGLEYGVNDRLVVGLGRSTFEKTYDGFMKMKLLRQSTGVKKMPLSLSYFGSIAINSLEWEDPERTNYFSSRMSYVNQLLFARKFSNAISLQLTPSLIHKNLVKYAADHNTAFAIGIGGRVKLSSRVSLNAEYFYVPDAQYVEQYSNSLSIGFDIETGGHVFQLHLTNSRPMFERGFITETTGKWSEGDIHFGFNISRVFTIKKPEGF